MIGTVPAWLETLRLLAVSAAGFFLGAMCVLLPRFKGARVKIDRVQLSSKEVTLAVAGTLLLSVYAFWDMIAHFHSEQFTRRSPFYLIAFICLDILAIILARKYRQAHRSS